MYHVYLYLPDALADWENRPFDCGIALETLLSSRRTVRGGANHCLLPKPVRTMGGLCIAPDSTIDALPIDSETVLLLPGAGNEADYDAAIETAARLLDVGGTVCAICGATIALANAGLLDHHPHTSNGAGFLDAFCPAYKGQSFYVDAPSVSVGHLITAGATSALPWTKQILERLDVFNPVTLNAWYDYFTTGEARYFFALMQSLPSAYESRP